MVKSISKTISLTIKNEDASFTTSKFHPATPVNTLFAFGKAVNSLQNSTMTQLKKTTIAELVLL